VSAAAIDGVAVVVGGGAGILGHLRRATVARPGALTIGSAHAAQAVPIGERSLLPHSMLALNKPM